MIRTGTTIRIGRPPRGRRTYKERFVLDILPGMILSAAFFYIIFVDRVWMAQ